MASYNHIDYLLFTAVQEQNFEQVQKLWDQHDPSVFGSDTLMAALVKESDEVFYFVVDRSPDLYISQTIHLALGNTQRFEYMLPRADVTLNGSLPLSRAVQEDNMAMVRFLLPLSNLNDPACDALYHALFEELPDMVELLYPVCNIKATMDQLINSEYECDAAIEWLQEKLNHTQNQKLHHEVHHMGGSRKRKL